MSHPFLYKKLDQFCHDHNAKIMKNVRNESARLLSIWNDDVSNEDEVVSHQSESSSYVRIPPKH
jgi:hypothetical protein